MKKSCPRCKTKVIDMNWLDYEEDHFIENGQEFIKQGGTCNCKDEEGNEWIITYKLQPIKMEER